jgi:hypothetical protein
LTAGMREPYPTDLGRRQFSRSDKMTATPDGDRRLARRLEESRVQGRQALACRPRCAEGRRVRHQYPVNGRHRVQGGSPVGASPLRRKGLRTPRSGRAGCSACGNRYATFLTEGIKSSPERFSGKIDVILTRSCLKNRLEEQAKRTSQEQSSAVEGK